MSLSETQKRYLRGLGHQLKPIVMVGEAGLSASLLQEYETTLAHHELIKVRVKVGDRVERDALVNELCAKGKAELVQRVGNTALLYRPNPDKKKIVLPNP
ncbi:ribosome assembly RNA-binding protein YhbY [Gammaproteobacteria bacterium]|nr:ribosome assembly RNA-binding protein YhbY [Gammaproteobacteria bacterium]